MANLNKVMLIGRLTDNPEEPRVFSNGGKVVKFRFAVNNRKKNSQTGQWEDVPVYLDCEVFNRGETGKQADLVSQTLRKGHQVFLEGHLRFDQWMSQDGQKRSKLLVVVENFQYLERRQEGDVAESPSRYSQPSSPAVRKSQPPVSNAHYDDQPDMPEEQPGDDIPF
jgi:single-strand DNA-binding protein